MTVDVIEKEQGFTQEKLDAIGKGEVKINDLNATEREQLREYQKTGEIKEVEIANVEKSVPDATTEEIKPVEEIEFKAVQKKLFDKGVEANRQKQLKEKAEKESQFFKDQFDTLKNAEITKATDDQFDTETQQNKDDRLAALEAYVQADIEYKKNNALVTQQEAHTIEQDLETQKGSLSIQQLQNNFPQLKTSKPIHQLDRELQDFSTAVGGMENVNKYLDDPVYKKQVDDQGVAPLSDDFMSNLPTYNKIVDLNHKYAVSKNDAGHSYKDRNPDVSIDNFYMNQLQNSGEYRKELSNAKLAGANSVADKVVSNKYTAVTIKPSAGADLPESGMTEAKAIEIISRVKPLIQSGQVLSQEQQAEYNEYKDFIKQNYNR